MGKSFILTRKTEVTDCCQTSDYEQIN